MKHSEITKLTNKSNGEVYEIITEGNLSFMIKLIHKYTVRKLKRHLKFAEKFNRINGR